MSKQPTRVHVRVIQDWTFEPDIWDIPEDATEDQIKEFFIEAALDGGGPDWDTLDAQATIEY